MRVPRWMMENRLRTREIPIAQKISGTSRMGLTLSRVSQSLYEQAEGMKCEESGEALNSYFEILTQCLGLSEAQLDAGRELRGKILRFLEMHITDPALGPAEIATAVGVSVRHLHRMFSAGGNTIGDYIRARRLQQCRKDLADPELRNKSITEIAFFWGFSDAAHFSHSFRKEFGISARKFRADAQQTQGSGFTPEANARAGDSALN